MHTKHLRLVNIAILLCVLATVCACAEVLKHAYKRIQTPQRLSMGTMATHEIALLVAVAALSISLLEELHGNAFYGGRPQYVVLWQR